MGGLFGLYLVRSIACIFLIFSINFYRDKHMKFLSFYLVLLVTFKMATSMEMSSSAQLSSDKTELFAQYQRTLEKCGDPQQLAYSHRGLDSNFNKDKGDVILVAHYGHLDSLYPKGITPPAIPVFLQYRSEKDEDNAAIILRQNIQVFGGYGSTYHEERVSNCKFNYGMKSDVTEVFPIEYQPTVENYNTYRLLDKDYCGTFCINGKVHLLPVCENENLSLIKTDSCSGETRVFPFSFEKVIEDKQESIINDDMRYCMTLIENNMNDPKILDDHKKYIQLKSFGIPDTNAGMSKRNLYIQAIMKILDGLMANKKK